MRQIGEIFANPIWQGLGAVFTLTSIFVTFYIATGDSIWLLLILWGFLSITAILLCIMLREQVRNHRSTDLYFYFMCMIIGLICCLLGLSLGAVGDFRATQIPPLAPSSTLTPTLMSTVTQATSTPTSTATQGDLLETWAYRTRMWLPPALMFPDVELKVESQPDSRPSYVFAYQFQDTNSATYSGFTFDLFQTPDLSAYKSVQIKFRFSDDRTNCFVGLTDNENHSFTKALGIVGTDYWTTVMFPLDVTFPGVNRHAITQVYVSASDPGDGLVHSCTINEIRFFKE